MSAFSVPSRGIYGVQGGSSDVITSSGDSSLEDAHGRHVSYLRVSVTDRCNLRCTYCRGLEKEEMLSHAKLLTYEEILRLVDIFVGLGVTKVRLTGGEPFARRDCAALLLRLRERFPSLNLRLTSNGTLLAPHMDAIVRARVDAVNLSLDSFDRKTFERVTGEDMLPRVIDALEELLARGVRVKLNAVAMRGVTDVQLASYVEAVRRWPVDLRFIEFMPMGSGTLWRKENFLGGDEILAGISRIAPLRPVDEGGLERDHGPAALYEVEGCRGRIGIISALSHHFCRTCNRLRVTSDGQLRTCLFADAQTPLRDMLRDPQKTDADVAAVIRAALTVKPVGADLLRARTATAVAARHMDRIGG